MKKSLGTLLLIFVLSLALMVTGCARQEQGPADQGQEGEENVVAKFNGRIIGIEPGAGLMAATETVIEEYGLNQYQLVDGSSAIMTASLADAIRNNEWVIVTGWTPHWKFARWDLKYLEDPKGIYGGDEQIHTLVRQGLEEDMPEVYAFLDNFNWELEDMQQVMVWNAEEGADFYENALRWIEENEEKVNSWIPEEEASEKGRVRLIFVEWDSEIASTYVVQAVLQEKMGYTVELISVDAGAMYQGLAAGDADGMVAAWLPTTHGHYVEQIQDRVVDLGVNLDGTRIGLVVPAYVTIDSIEELQ